MTFEQDTIDELESRVFALEGELSRLEQQLQDAETAGLDDYQEQAMRTHVEDPIRLPCYALGIAGEAGEVADMIKKHIGHGHTLDREKLKKELGDVLWYTAGLAHLFGLSLSEVAEANIEKLLKRYPDGFSHEASINRPKEEV